MGAEILTLSSPKKDDTYEINKPYEGASMMVMAFKNVEGTDPWPSPIIFHDPLYKNSGATMPVDGENANFIKVKTVFLVRIFARMIANPSEKQNRWTHSASSTAPTTSSSTRTTST